MNLSVIKYLQRTFPGCLWIYYQIDTLSYNCEHEWHNTPISLFSWPGELSHRVYANHWAKTLLLLCSSGTSRPEAKDSWKTSAWWPAGRPPTARPYGLRACKPHAWWAQQVFLQTEDSGIWTCELCSLSESLNFSCSSLQCGSMWENSLTLSTIWIDALSQNTSPYNVFPGVALTKSRGPPRS